MRPGFGHQKGQEPVHASITRRQCAAQRPTASVFRRVSPEMTAFLPRCGARRTPRGQICSEEGALVDTEQVRDYFDNRAPWDALSPPGTGTSEPA